MVGKTVSHYRIIEKLGSGGMGDVYVAENIHLKSRVALKFLPPHQSRDEEAKRRFIQEAQSASALNHPNVCTIHDIDEDEDGQLFIAMALYEGQTLKEKLESGPLSVEDAADIARQVAEGLAAAHEKDVVHRDIKPANIFITERGRAVILDFGLAKLQEATAVLTQSGSSMGTVAYMSPEQARGEPVDHRTDIWSLGVVLYEMLTGGRPYEAEYQQALIYKILNENPQALPPEADLLEPIVDSCLLKAVDDRMTDAATLASQLGTFVAPALVSGERPKATSSPTSWRWMAAAAVLVVVAAVTVFLVREKGTPEDTLTVRQGLVVFPFSVGGAPELEYLEEGMVDLLSTALDGAGDLRAVDPYLVLGEVQRSGEDPHDPVAATRIVQRLGANSFVLGNILKVGQQIRLSASHYSESGEILSRSDGRIGSEDELLTAVDNLALDILVESVGVRDAGRLSLAAATTESISALKVYLSGEKALREGRFEEARGELRNAVDQDSTFALAWYRLGHASAWLDDAVDGAQFSLKAAALGDRLPDRLRRLVEAEAAGYRGDVNRSLDIYRELTREYPRDAHAWQALGDQLHHIGIVTGRSIQRSREPLERALALDPGSSEALLHLIELATWEGEYARADSLIRTYPEERSRRKFNLDIELAQASDDAERDSLLAVYGTELSLRDLTYFGHHTPRRASVADIYSPVARDLEAGERAYQMVIDRGDRRWEGRLAAYRLARTGKWNAAMADVEMSPLGLSIWALSPFGVFLEDRLAAIRERVLSDSVDLGSADPRWVGQEPVFQAFLGGLLSAKMDEWDEVLRHLAMLRDGAQEPGDPGFAAGFANTLDAYIAWNEGDAGRAENLLSAIQIPNASSPGAGVSGRMFDRTLRARIRMEEGKFAEALEIWESLAQSHFITTVPSYLYRAQCYEGMGQSDKAIAYYQALVDMWTDADLELQPMVDEARAGLERLLDAEAREPS